jgi:hypothetical protein
MTKKPYGVKGVLMLSGYVWSALNRTRRPISEELLGFHRGEQLRRLKQKFLKASSG